ncbi:MAG TPA: YggS family pyridoxal phosphate-dependent enzyme [Candidatus Polarisedimenticolaceae bacterium]|nr:YggS family pyridoxal phosphate-dependent enzyme [Candidatus Polarisedimenticolaceae bacterium]
MNDSTVEDCYRAVRRRIEAACARADRDPREVRLVAITKTVPAETIRRLLACGHHLLGENRVQEVLPKIDELGNEADWHFVGHLQRNKVRQVVGRFSLIHSLDDTRLAAELDRRAGEAGLRQAVLLQVNAAGESTKFGVAPEEVGPVVDRVAAFGRLELRGLMTVPPPAGEAEDSRRWFAGLRELRDRAAARSGLPLPELSMGMTDDFEVAIEEGATLIRVGRALFGER